MQVLKSLGVLSVRRIMGSIYGGMGLLPFFLLLAILGLVRGQNQSPIAGVVGMVFAIAMPLIHGLTGFVSWSDLIQLPVEVGWRV